MAKRREPEPPPRLRLIKPEAEARQRIQTQIERGIQLKDRPITSSEELRQAKQDKDAWKDFNEQLMLALFNYRSILDVYYQTSQVRTIKMVRSDFAVPLQSQVRDFQEGVDYSLSRLRSVLASLELFAEAETETQAPTKDVSDSSQRTGRADSSTQSERLTIINMGEIYLGDVGEVLRNISGSTLINKGMVAESFNKVRANYDDKTSLALVRVAEEVDKSGNPDAAELFEAFNEELQKPEPKRSVLRSCWDGLVKAVPTLVQVGDLAVNIAKLFLPPPG
jgi:hypothetical protein